ncbi:MAG: DUF2202 domain-containing protein [Peptostreptococcaceae bacterium]|nr:DUF2202 domain-containing protein [Peptostreptococcaceae bacterium]
MSTNKNSLKLNHHLKISILVLTLITFSIFFMVGCSSSTDDQSATADTSEETTQDIDHNVDPDPTPLSEDDETTSLEGYGAVGALSDDDLSIMDMLTYAVEDEYLAHGEYVAIMDKFGEQKPYSNIAEAELTHLAYLEEVYVSYGLEFPTDASADHIVVPEDLLEAAETGVQAEIDNIAMYEIFLSYDLPENVSDVFTALMNGSESHLLAFQK